MAKQVITITIEDGKNTEGRDGINCNIHVQAENEAGSFSHLVAVGISERFKDIIEVISEYIQVQQERKNRNAISLTRSIH